MADTDLEYWLETENDTDPPHRDALAAPEVQYSIYTDESGPLIWTKLKYKDGSGDVWTKVDRAKYHVPSGPSELTLVFKWRDSLPASEEEMIYVTAESNPAGNSTKVSSHANRETRISLEVPASAGGEFRWDIKGGDPGFQLKAKVRRQ